MDCSTAIRTTLISLFGSEVYLPEGGLNRPYLAGKIFGNKELLQKVNETVHPAVREDFQTWASRQRSTIVGIESAILFEAGFDCEVDSTLLVTCPPSVRIERVMKRDNCTTEQVEARICNQTDDSAKATKADFIIVNDSMQALLPQLISFIKSLAPKE